MSNLAPSLHIHKDCPHTAFNHRFGGNPILLDQDVATGNATLKRAAKCYNALTGIPDPAAAIQAAREALKYAVRMLDAKEHDVAFAQEALNLLTPAP